MEVINNENCSYSSYISERKNSLIYKSVKKAVAHLDYEVINLGVFNDSTKIYTYNETAIFISLLLSSKSVDFVVTGCSSGQGMMFACNSLPNVMYG